MAVSYIQSIYWEYGSGCVLPRTGVLWQNRGVSFSLDQGRVNPLAPGRKPFHTLNPALALFDDGRVISYGAWAATASRSSRPRSLPATDLAWVSRRPSMRRAGCSARHGDGRRRLKLESRFDPTLLRALERPAMPSRYCPKPTPTGWAMPACLLRDAGGHRSMRRTTRAPMAARPEFEERPLDGPRVGETAMLV